MALRYTQRKEGSAPSSFPHWVMIDPCLIECRRADLPFIWKCSIDDLSVKGAQDCKSAEIKSVFVGLTVPLKMVPNARLLIISIHRSKCIYLTLFVLFFYMADQQHCDNSCEMRHHWLSHSIRNERVNILHLYRFSPKLELSWMLQ